MTEDSSDFNSTLGRLDHHPDVTKTRPSTIRSAPFFGIGKTLTYIIQTYRTKDEGDLISIEHVDANEKVHRLILPGKVATAIARQRDQLTKKSRSKAAKIRADEAKERGEIPGFMRRVK